MTQNCSNREYNILADLTRISTSLEVGHLSCVAHGPKKIFKIPFAISFDRRPIKYSYMRSKFQKVGPVVLEPYIVLKMLTPHGRMDGHLTSFAGHLRRGD